MHRRGRVHWMLKKHAECICKVKDDKRLAKAIQNVLPPCVSCRWACCQTRDVYVNVLFQAGRGNVDGLYF